MINFVSSRLSRLVKYLDWLHIQRSNNEYVKLPCSLIHDNFKTLAIIYTLSKLDEHCAYPRINILSNSTVNYFNGRLLTTTYFST